MIPESIVSELRIYTGKIISYKQCSGGSINHTFVLDCEEGNFFLKYNPDPPSPDMFLREQRGLELLSTKEGPSIPKVFANGQTENGIFLLLEYIESGKKNNVYWNNFGRALSSLHQQSNPQFGEARDNFIGSLYQSNKWSDSWSEFFTNERVLPQFNMARKSGYLDSNSQKQIENLLKQIDDIFPKEMPALLHGDLWNGNIMAGENNRAWIFDPATYYGHREMDIAMTKLFGGFDKLFYESYNEISPLEPGWEKRVDICNLYPLLVHVNLFGGGYIADIQYILNRF